MPFSSVVSWEELGRYVRVHGLEGLVIYCFADHLARNQVEINRRTDSAIERRTLRYWCATDSLDPHAEGS